MALETETTPSMTSSFFTHRTLSYNSTAVFAANSGLVDPAVTDTPSEDESGWSQTAVTNTPYSGVPCSDSLFFFLLHGPIFGLVCGIGLVGNTLSFAILHKYSKDNVSSYLLKSLAVMDNFFLAGTAFVQIYPAMMVHRGHLNQLAPIFPYFQIYVWPFVHIGQLGTVWTMVLVAGNRYVAVCRPLHAARLCTKNNIKRQIALLLVSITVYNIPRFVEYRYIYVNATSSVDNSTVTTEEVNIGLTSLPLYNILYENVAYCVFAYLLPLGVLIVFNVHLVKELKRAQRSRQTLIGHSAAEENNITFVMIIIIISFIVCETPASINQVLYFVVDDVSRQTCSYYCRFNYVSNLMITTNSSINFFIYCLFRKQFRQELHALFACRRKPISGRKRLLLRKTVILRAMHKTQPSHRNATSLLLDTQSSVVSTGNCSQLDTNVSFETDFLNNSFATYSTDGGTGRCSPDGDNVGGE